jgi:hypothetical protein
MTPDPFLLRVPFSLRVSFFQPDDCLWPAPASAMMVKPQSGCHSQILIGLLARRTPRQHCMSHIFIDGLPGLSNSVGKLSLHTFGLSAFIRSAHFIARLSLDSSQVAWLFERSPVFLSQEKWNLPRRIFISGSDLWGSEKYELVAELTETEGGGALVSARNALTGRQLWEHFIPVPEPADWAEAAPAWPGAQTEEIDAFFASDANCLVVCISRESRRRRMYSRDVIVDTVPPHTCQTDAIRLDPSTGEALWRATFLGVAVGIVQRRTFSGIWSSKQLVGRVDFEAGTNRVLHEYDHPFGWPVNDGACVAASWHSKGEVGIVWLDERGLEVRKGSWPVPRVNTTRLHHTEAGIAIQANDQSLWWLGNEDLPGWNIRAKPYIYRVYCCPCTDVFVGTDGRGGRLLAFDPASGKETLNVKPGLGGAGTLSKVPGDDVLVARFWTSRRDTTDGSLFVLSMTDRRHQLECQCRDLVGTWQHGAVCVAGQESERLAIVDVR